MGGFDQLKNKHKASFAAQSVVGLLAVCFAVLPMHLVIIFRVASEWQRGRDDSGYLQIHEDGRTKGYVSVHCELLLRRLE